MSVRPWHISPAYPSPHTLRLLIQQTQFHLDIYLIWTEIPSKAQCFHWQNNHWNETQIKLWFIFVNKYCAYFIRFYSFCQIKVRIQKTIPNVFSFNGNCLLCKYLRVPVDFSKKIDETVNFLICKTITVHFRSLKFSINGKENFFFWNCLK